MSGNEHGPHSPWGRPGDERNDSSGWGNEQNQQPSDAPQANSWGGASDAPTQQQPTQQSPWGDVPDAGQQSSWGNAPDAGHPSTSEQPTMAQPTTPQPAWETSGGAQQHPSTGQFPAPESAPLDGGTVLPAYAGTDAGHGAPGPGGPGVPPSGGTSAGASTPWYKRKGILIGGIGGVALLILAAVGIPLGIHLSNVAKGDQLADEFNSALAEYNSVWTSEAMDDVSNVVVSQALQENGDFYAQGNAAMADLTARCEGVATAKTTLDTLLAAPLPTLADEGGADASAKYQEAKATSDGLAGKRDAFELLANDGAAAITELSGFCTQFPEYNSILNAYGVAITDVYLPTMTIPAGSNIQFSGGLYMTCQYSLGCPNYADQGARTAHGDAIDASYTTFYQSLADKAGSACFLSDFQAVCDTMAADYAGVAAKFKAASDAIRTEQPVLTVGSLPMPNFMAAFPAALDSVGAADNNVNATWQSVDPNTAGDTASGWQARSLKAALGVYEATVTDAIAQMR